MHHCWTAAMKVSREIVGPAAAPYWDSMHKDLTHKDLIHGHSAVSRHDRRPALLVAVAPVLADRLAQESKLA